MDISPDPLGGGANNLQSISATLERRACEDMNKGGGHLVSILLCLYAQLVHLLYQLVVLCLPLSSNDGLFVKV